LSKNCWVLRLYLGQKGDFFIEHCIDLNV